jgi:molybdenum cofactor cytidylyltransferase
MHKFARNNGSCGPILNSVNRSSIPKVFSIVLAAGSSTRYGTTKQLCEIDGVTLVRRACELAEEISGASSLLVAGHDWQAVTRACEPLAGFVLRNERPNDGIGNSLSLAARALPQTADAAFVLLADQPLISAAHLRAMLDLWSGAENEIIATAFAATQGPPVLFPRACFAALAMLEGDQGAKQLLNDDRFKVQTVRFEAAALDIDRPQDLQQLS